MNKFEHFKNMYGLNFFDIFSRIIGLRFFRIFPTEGGRDCSNEPTPNTSSNSNNAESVPTLNVPPSGEVDAIAQLVNDMAIETVRRILTDSCLKDSGADAVLRRRLIKHFKGQPPSPKPPTATAAPSAPLPPPFVWPTPPPTRPIYDWGISFSGFRPVEFLEELFEKIEIYRADPDSVFSNISVLLRGDALLWWRNNHQYWKNLTDFTDAFRLTYFPNDYFLKIEEELITRRQRPTEKGFDFVNKMQTMARRHGNFGDSRLLCCIHRNLRAEYRQYIRREEFDSLPTLLIKIKEYEDLLPELGEAAATPPPPRTIPHKNTYTPRSGQTTRSPQIPNTRQSERPPLKCFRCGELGHLRYNCSAPSRIFCSKCNRQGVLSRDCCLRQSGNEPNASSN